MQPTQQQVVPVIFLRVTATSWPQTLTLNPAYDHLVTYISYTPYDSGLKQLEVYDDSGNYYFQGYADVANPGLWFPEFVMQDASELSATGDASAFRLCIGGYRLAPSATEVFT